MRIRAMNPVYVPVPAAEKQEITNRIEAKYKGFIIGQDDPAVLDIQKYGQVVVKPFTSPEPITPTHPAAPISFEELNNAVDMMTQEEIHASVRREWGIK